jgi:hypothetical protein
VGPLSEITCKKELEFFLSNIVSFLFNQKAQHIAAKLTIIWLHELGLKFLSHEPNKANIIFGG